MVQHTENKHQVPLRVYPSKRFLPPPPPFLFVPMSSGMHHWQRNLHAWQKQGLSPFLHIPSPFFAFSGHLCIIIHPSPHHDHSDFLKQNHKIKYKAAMQKKVQDELWHCENGARTCDSGLQQARGSAHLSTRTQQSAVSLCFLIKLWWRKTGYGRSALRTENMISIIWKCQKETETKLRQTAHQQTQARCPTAITYAPALKLLRAFAKLVKNGFCIYYCIFGSRKQSASSGSFPVLLRSGRDSPLLC